MRDFSKGTCLLFICREAQRAQSGVQVTPADAVASLAPSNPKENTCVEGGGREEI